MALPPTPPSSNPNSPTSPTTTTSEGDAVINFDADIEKQNYNNEKLTDFNKSAPRENGSPDCAESPPKYSLHRRISEYVRIDDHPKGYPQLAAFVNSDPNFLMCRRFGFLHSRVLLYRQDELVQLEKELVDLDDEDAELNPKALISREIDDRRQDAPRKALIHDIDEKLKQYDELVLRCQAFTALQRPLTRNYNSFANWMNNKKPLSRSESKFVTHDEDFIALADGQEGGWFDCFVEDFLKVLPCRLSRFLFTSETERRKTDDAYVHLYSKKRLDTLVRLVITLLAVALLMAPVVVLFSVEEHGGIKIGVILLFTFFFSAALSVFTKAKRHEVFAATAA
ncbi:hypothetical protein MMC16_004192 [Acarospora aff. strigata]|nr:hypothetical protein [Acarospora aff. strigata]